MKLTIAQIDKVLHSGEAISVTVPAAGGEMTILGHHMPLITTLVKGDIVVREEGKPEKVFPVETGFLEIGKTETVILV
jgi:F-type H+-transporting ATPase subunit epsilon